jgi:hypothetical protein
MALIKRNTSQASVFILVQHGGKVMKITNAITKWLLGAAMAGAFLLAVPNKAQAQVVVAAGNFERPAVVLYQPARYGYWHNDYRRREFYGYRGYYRHDRWDRYHYRRY